MTGIIFIIAVMSLIGSVKAKTIKFDSKFSRTAKEIQG